MFEKVGSRNNEETLKMGTARRKPTVSSQFRVRKTHTHTHTHAHPHPDRHTYTHTHRLPLLRFKLNNQLKIEDCTVHGQNE